jgi:nucleotide-binding universal stress UspA family protein
MTTMMGGTGMTGTGMTATGLPEMAVTMPNAIEFEVHHRTRAARGLDAAPRHRADTRSEPSTSHRLSRILVATDGTAASEGAVIVAGLLARRHHASVDVVSVLPRWGEPPPDHEFLGITGELLEERLAAVIPQGQRALGNGTPFWAIKVIDSTSAVYSIAEIARTEGHDLIVTGNRRSWITRWLRRPTALAVAQRSNVPVLVVPQSVSTLPARAVVGVEGTDFDVTTAATAVGVLAERAAVHLVHVDSTEAAVARETEDQRSGAGRAVRFAEVERAIADSDIGGVNSVVLRGREPAARLVAYAKGVQADLVVAGTRSPATIAERVSGGVGGRVLRAADCCVLLCGTEHRTGL